MIILKTENQIAKMKKSGEILAGLHREIAKMIKPDFFIFAIYRICCRYELYD